MIPHRDYLSLIMDRAGISIGRGFASLCLTACWRDRLAGTRPQCAEDGAGRCAAGDPGARAPARFNGLTGARLELSDPGMDYFFFFFFPAQAVAPQDDAGFHFTFSRCPGKPGVRYHRWLALLACWLAWRASAPFGWNSGGSSSCRGWAGRAGRCHETRTGARRHLVVRSQETTSSISATAEEGLVELHGNGQRPDTTPLRLAKPAPITSRLMGLTEQCRALAPAPGDVQHFLPPRN